MKLPALETNKLNAKSRLLQTQNLEAMPRLISEQDWPISDEEVNKATLKKLLPNAIELETIEGNKLYREGTPYDGSYFLVNTEEDLISYYMEYEVHAAHFEGVHSVTQTSVWRSLSPSNPKGLASHVLFKYLVPKYPAVMSDKVQTTRGRDFWITLMSDALTKGLKVELVSMATHKTFPIETKTDLRKWTQDKATAWGWGLHYEQIRFVIRKP